MTDDIDDRTDAPALATGLNLIDRATRGGPAPYACCPRDGEPLIPTFERRGAEFHCLVCGVWYGFLSPTPKDPTPELAERYAELKARFDAGERGPS